MVVMQRTLCLLINSLPAHVDRINQSVVLLLQTQFILFSCFCLQVVFSYPDRKYNSYNSPMYVLLLCSYKKEKGRRRESASLLYSNQKEKFKAISCLSLNNKANIYLFSE